jgi:hypothetical protein
MASKVGGMGQIIAVVDRTCNEDLMAPRQELELVQRPDFLTLVWWIRQSV